MHCHWTELLVLKFKILNMTSVGFGAVKHFQFISIVDPDERQAWQIVYMESLIRA